MGISVHRVAALVAATLFAAALERPAAQAADLRSPPPPLVAPLAFNPAPVADWEGLYAGSVYGVGFGSFRSTQIGTRTVSTTGQTGGALLGYNWQYGKFVYGVEGDITLHVLRTINPGTVGLIPTRVDTMYSAHARARLGYDLGDFLPFIAGGIVNNETYQSTTLPADWFGADRRQWGWTIGGGLDFKMTLPVMGPVVLRAEYLYEGYPQSTFLGLPGGPINTRVSSQFIRLGLISRIGATGPRPASNSPASFDWSGTYGGAIAGGSWVGAHSKGGGVATSISASGPVGGIFAGHNFQFGQFVVGWDGSSSLSNFTGNGALPGAANVSFRGNIETDLRGRAGYAFGNWLPYVAAGLLWERSEQIDRITGSELGRIAADSWTVGAGLDYAVTDRIFLRGEYLYGKTYSVSAPNLNGCACSQSQDSSLIRVGAAYLFH